MGPVRAATSFGRHYPLFPEHSTARLERMTITFVDPEELPNAGLFHQVSIASGSKLVFVAGQLSRNAAGEHVGVGDFAAQLEQCYVNVAAALAGAGCSWNEVVKRTLYVVGWSPDKVPQLVEGLTRASARLGITSAPPATLIGVAALAEPELLVEVEVVAVVD
jgi:enamine deaminase RidA (YjgF/YER057c/UK114 family)